MEEVAGQPMGGMQLQKQCEADEALARRLAAEEDAAWMADNMQVTRSGRLVKRALVDPPEEDMPVSKQAKRACGKVDKDSKVTSDFFSGKDKKVRASASAVLLANTLPKPPARHSAPARHDMTKKQAGREQPMADLGGPVVDGAGLQHVPDARAVHDVQGEGTLQPAQSGQQSSKQPSRASSERAPDTCAPTSSVAAHGQESQQPCSPGLANASTKVMKPSGKRKSGSSSSPAAGLCTAVQDREALTMAEIPSCQTEAAGTHITALPAVSMLPQALRDAAAELQHPVCLFPGDSAPPSCQAHKEEPALHAPAVPRPTVQRSASKVIPSPGAFKPTTPAMPLPAALSAASVQQLSCRPPRSKPSGGDEDAWAAVPAAGTSSASGVPSGGPASGGPASGPGLANGMFVATNRAVTKFRVPGLKRGAGLARRV